ncbi:hypothetical protein STCU_06656 [Strigomonas culicis]|uniref:Serine aminopeptidase S33 domain-containing protein n=1 Tax=Strigomonas culicis TaxID=28005 RepID=S9U4B3_9TRYP|nr:hypothetical protein STCU_06656 [Strigomonas culicis]|eukprot:EPY25587.1 hypothetical protein STCU_06656 [Strigomonas culicis]
MMEDAAGLLEHVLAEKHARVEEAGDGGAAVPASTRAHVFGMSMGGMIAQLLAIHYPERVLSLNLMMTHVGGKHMIHPSLLTYTHLLRAPAKSKEQYADNMIAFIDFLSVGSYRTASSDDEAAAGEDGPDAAAGPRPTPQQRADAMREELRLYILKGCERDGFRVAVDRQAAAVVRAPSRLTQLQALNADCYPPAPRAHTAGARRHIPTLVLHGHKDPLIPVANALRLASAINGARLVLYPQLGHDFPPPLYQSLAKEILLNMSKAPEMK